MRSGTIQEGKAQNTLRALRTYIQGTTTVLRDGQEVIISDKKLVPGDIIVLREMYRKKVTSLKRRN